MKIDRFGFGFGFNLPDRLGRISDLRKYTGLDLGLGSICHTGWVGFWICENSQVRIWVWVQSARQVGISDLKNTWVSVTGLCLISKTGLVSSTVSNNKLVMCQLVTRIWMDHGSS